MWLLGRSRWWTCVWGGCGDIGAGPCGKRQRGQRGQPLALEAVPLDCDVVSVDLQTCHAGLVFVLLC